MKKLMKNNSGFTLIEVLVAIVVLAIGLLGLAGLQARSLQYNYSAYERSQASILAYDIVDRMRANASITDTGAYDTDFGTNPPGGIDCQDITANCSTAAMANFDLTQWKCSLGNFLGNAACAAVNMTGVGALAEGDGSIVRNGSLITVTIRWVDDRTVDGPNRFTSFTASTQLL